MVCRYQLNETPGMDIDDFKRQFGLRVQSFRKRQRLTQEELAERIGRSTDTVSNIERGLNSTRIETVFRIAEVLEVPFIDLFDVDQIQTADRERRALIEKLLNLISGEEAKVLEGIIAQAEILLQVKSTGR